MSKYLAAAVLFATAAILASGCCCLDQVYCPSNCASGLDSVQGSCDSCGAGGGGCGQSSCQTVRNNLTCCKGCGDVYWGEWISDPPDDCDPCDGCGNWVGPRCCPPRWWDCFKCGAPGLWGWRCGSQACCDGESDCASSGADHFPLNGEEVIEGKVAPSPAAPHQAVPNHKSGPTEAKPQGSTPSQPMPNTHTSHMHHHRHAPARLQLQPTRSSPAPLRPVPSKPSRSRSL